MCVCVSVNVYVCVVGARAQKHSAFVEASEMVVGLCVHVRMPVHRHVEESHVDMVGLCSVPSPQSAWQALAKMHWNSALSRRWK